jgi:hypothetical protein
VQGDREPHTHAGSHGASASTRTRTGSWWPGDEQCSCAGDEQPRPFADQAQARHRLLLRLLHSGCDGRGEGDQASKPGAARGGDGGGAARADGSCPLPSSRRCPSRLTDGPSSSRSGRHTGLPAGKVCPRIAGADTGGRPWRVAGTGTQISSRARAWARDTGFRGHSARCHL